MHLNILERIAEYRKLNAISQSYLKSLLSDRKYDEKDELKFLPGNLVDVMIYGTEEDVQLKYAILDGVRCDPMYLKIIDDLKVQYVDLPNLDQISEEEIVNAFKRNTNLKWSNEVIYNKTIENISVYWEKLQQIGDRVIITNEEYDRAVKEVEILKSNPITAQYINLAHPIDQMPFTGYYKGVFCKILPDRINIDVVNKTIQLLDFKRTDASYKQYLIIAKNLDYPFQMAFYKEVLQSFYPDYHILNPILVVVSSLGYSFIVKLSELDLQIGKYGYTSQKDYFTNGTEYRVGYTRLGFDGAIELYKKAASQGLLESQNIECILNNYEHNSIF